MKQTEQDAANRQKELEAIIEQHKAAAKEVEVSIQNGTHPEIRRVTDLLEQCELAHQEKIAMLVQREIRIRELEQ